VSKTNFDRYLENELKDPEFALRFDEAGKAWDVALQLARIREKTGLSQKELARRTGTTQQQISRLESTEYEGHSLRMLRRVARELDVQLVVGFEPISAKSRGGMRTAKRKLNARAKT